MIVGNKLVIIIALVSNRWHWQLVVKSTGEAIKQSFSGSRCYCQEKEILNISLAELQLDYKGVKFEESGCNRCTCNISKV
ncbi:MAG TPA: hypothetical protein DCL21_01855 [Alphaproteobacteria bacterium]|nr:hypothetical protein [Alphaproteobacteria bacterium]